MSSSSRPHSHSHAASSPSNRPLQLAVLGASGVGKSTLVSRVTVHHAPTAHHPTTQHSSWLAHYEPHSPLARTLLDPQPQRRLCLRTPSSICPDPLFASPCLGLTLLGPLVYSAFLDEYTEASSQLQLQLQPQVPSLSLSQTQTRAQAHNSLIQTRQSSIRSGSHMRLPMRSDYTLPANYIPPHFHPITLDIIDTKPYDPASVVPFLEVSLFSRNLGKNVLHNLADSPRHPVSTSALLVASGASELNANIDGYLLVYSAVPELNRRSQPPAYGNSNSNEMQGEGAHDDDGGLATVRDVRDAIIEAWTEYRDYKARWVKGQESDVYSLAHSWKTIWHTPSQELAKEKTRHDLRTFQTSLQPLDLNPRSPESPPPMIVVCTHATSPRASDALIQRGLQLANSWDCSFVALDSIDNLNVDVAFSLLIREIVEKQILQRNT
ncbi:hypothetical protein TBLA_0F03170 [Henningerozyma blattae CBS 6284]|uniref:Uncharacterized protein n=1 Tax=Henningerozyma blattae (strain ATCC 34711 / CBS 6284 / DSM 70876 / NBRC 10599 / NRRL Y-10934 / UCD 77-7) TaxID=1071380 RepID=I2H653_HENB6|nr:hypothetical protein TBLA_0F03170 [Tetrapisispora blattae CBS 6284]CCH61855.1 hypothetical protein TBLA_0F03170 [Tetrapisispora blattae CBS 6284]